MKNGIGSVMEILGAEVLSANWWVIALRGLLGILVGFLAFLLPIPSLIAMVWLFGAYAFLDGLFCLVTVWRKTRSRPWWSLVIQGVAGVAVGVISFLWPGITALALVYLIAAWALVSGGLQIAAAIRLRKEIKGEWLLALSGVFSVLLGGLMAFAPDAGAIGLVWFFGAYCIAFGALLIGLSFKLRTRYEELTGQRAHAAA